MTLLDGPPLPLLALLAPLVLAGLAWLPRLRARALLLLPVAPLPALLLALAGPREGETIVPDLLFGVVLGLDGDRALLLAMAAALWLAAGLYAVRSMANTKRVEVFVSFWCMTLAGNLGVFLALDAVTFYAAFSAVTLAAWVLVVHDGTARALDAGRTYIVLALLGEAALLAGLVISATAADSLIIADISDALGAGFPLAPLALGLLVAGFGLKAGLVPLHVWLPLAHPVAPTPASAVLSGAIVKAGIAGFLWILPAAGPADLSVALVWAGVGGAWYGILAGLFQREPKAILAYSTVSQMGLVIAVAGAAIGAADGAEARGIAALYAAHHGFAKGALFLSVGVVAAAAPGRLVPVVAVTALVAASVAGLPPTGGAAVKAALKQPFGDGAAGTAVALSAFGTSLLLLTFLGRAVATRDAAKAAGPPAGLLLPFLAMAAGALVLPWVLLPAFSGLSRAYPLEPQTLWSATWPVAAALLLALAAAATRWSLPALPPGDIGIPVRRALARLGALRPPPLAGALGGIARRGAGAARWPRLPARLADRVDLSLRAWSLAGILIVLMALVA